MAWYDKVLPTLAAVAPTIATALGGPLAGMGVNVLFDVLGVNNEKEAQEAIIGMNPEIAARVRAADQEFAAKMAALDIDLERINQSDRASAREREVAVRDRTPAILGYTIIGSFIAVVGAVLSGNVVGLNDPNAIAIIGALIGYLSAKGDTVVAYYFGSSAGSKSKTDALATALHEKTERQ